MRHAFHVSDVSKGFVRLLVVQSLDLYCPTEKFDSSKDRGHTFLWKVGNNQVIEGMDKAVVRMSRGQIAEVTIPYELAYGEQGYPPVIPPKSNLMFEIELIDISPL